MSMMRKELLLSPNAVRSVVDGNGATIKKIAEEFKARGLSNVTTVARGTSDSAATYFKYVSEIIANIPVSKYLPSVTTVYNARPIFKHNMLLAISQSGQSTDTMLALNAAKSQGALTVAITNDAQSPLAQLADFHIFLNAGEEHSVSATKTFLAQLAALFLLANALAEHPAKLNIHKIPALLEAFLEEKQDEISAVSARCSALNNVVVLSRGLMQGVANELAMKLMETSYLLSRPFSTSDFMHGPLAVVSEGTSVILLAPSGELSAEFVDIATRLSLLGANLVAFTDMKEIQQIATDFVDMPTLHSLEAPFVYASAVQLFAENLAVAKGLNPDISKNLKKVTITK